jgi:hypothetical protein
VLIIIQNILEERKCEGQGSQKMIKTLMPPIGLQKLEGSANPKCNPEKDQTTHL